jgi:hypothetical protein
MIELDEVALNGELSGGHDRGRVESERQEKCRRRKGKGREPSSATDRGCPGMGCGGNRQ